MFWVQNFTQMSIMRFLLGVFEAGFFPGMIYYFTYWFPAKYRVSVIATFFVAFPIGNMIGAPLATQIMDNITWLGQDGWRWVFMIEGIMAILGTTSYSRISPKTLIGLNRKKRTG
nr:MFS transporter [Priestia megaterium]